MNINNDSTNLKDDQFILPSISIGAFLLSDELDVNLTELCTDEGARRAKVHRFWGGSQAALKQLNIESYDLILVEFDEEPKNIGRIVEEIASMCPADTKAIIAGQVNDITLYRGLIELGVSEYIPAPFSKDKILKSLNKIYSNYSYDQCRTTVFIGSKGGVGTSVLANNASYYTSKSLKNNTVLLDLDFNFGSSSLYFNLPNKNQFQDVICGINSIDSVLMKRIVFDISDRLSVFSYRSPIDKTQNINKDIINSIFENCKKISNHVIIDLGNDLSDKYNDVIISANEIVIVTEPNIINLRNTAFIIDFIRNISVKIPNINIIINNVNRNKNYELSESEFIKITGISNCFKLSHYPIEFSRAEDRETVILSKQANTKSSIDLRLILDKIFDTDSKQNIKFRSSIFDIFKKA
ncbi:hypothetical protein [Ochrobactrum sp. Marseille-Q0166]|uniref:hypothetical protein n=1 Tax=Ochrobactrum sp. Marseille-Q0166 TaxID=2761105 RepID=UPI0016558C10|nr:hypothetical protein [Ochrobactrum sp. Marseille-Q0166]MBC8719081.1 hypothetical protein [Ochrobactrum sp. Marseille-Q0166]